MSHSNNGFELAQIDLEIRGPGELSGLRQSGLADLKIASLSDIAMVNSARQAAEEIVKLGLENYSALKDKILQFENAKHLE
jgi:ATP-dependent DNA helicase RecG